MLEAMSVEMPSQRPKELIDGHPVDRTNLNVHGGLMGDNDLVPAFRRIAALNARHIQLRLEQVGAQGVKKGVVLEACGADIGKQQ